MRRLPWGLSCAIGGFVACEVHVAAPDLSGLLGDRGNGEEAGSDAPWTPDPAGEGLGGVDAGDDGASEDPGRDPFRDPGSPADLESESSPELPEEPRLGNASCRSNEGCVSGLCRDGRCRCLETRHCESGEWCDGGPTAVRDTGECLPKRDLTAGCRFHDQCGTGACDPTGYCAWCAPGGVECEEGKVCCFGACRQGCLGCAVAPPPAPVYTPCATGCYDASVEFCGPSGGEPKRTEGSDCQFQDSWCLSGVCRTEDLRSSVCAECRDAQDCEARHGGGVCLGGRCVWP